MSAQRLYDLERMPARGYLDFFEQVTIFELTPRVLDAWVDWVMDRWPDHAPKTPPPHRE